MGPYFSLGTLVWVPPFNQGPRCGSNIFNWNQLSGVGHYFLIGCAEFAKITILIDTQNIPKVRYIFYFHMLHANQSLIQISDPSFGLGTHTLGSLSRIKDPYSCLLIIRDPLSFSLRTHTYVAHSD